MTTDIQLRAAVASPGGRHLVAQKPEPIRTVADLLSALAMDWHVPAHRRTLCVWPSACFVRTATGDIPVNGGPYSLAGFVRFEAQYMFPGMFETENSPDGESHSATLTARGVEFAGLGVLDYHRWGASVRACAFFCPRTEQIQQDARLPPAAQGGA